MKALKIFADKMGSTIIAEGIERQEELETFSNSASITARAICSGDPNQGWARRTRNRSSA